MCNGNPLILYTFHYTVRSNADIDRYIPKQYLFEDIHFYT